MENIPSKKKPSKFKRSESAETELSTSKRTKLTRSKSGIYGAFRTESTIYYIPYFMFVVGKDLLFRIRPDYQIPVVPYKPFLPRLEPLLFDIKLSNIYEQYGIQLHGEEKKDDTQVQVQHFRRDLKLAKIELLFEQGIEDLDQIAKDYRFTKTQVKRSFDKFKSNQPVIPKIKKQKKIQAVHREFIAQILEEEGHISITLHEIKEMLFQHFEFPEQKLALTTISKAIKELGYTRKKVSFILEARNEEATIKKRREVVEQLTNILSLGWKIIYIDESSFNINMKLKYGYSKKGSKAVVITQPKSINYSLLAAISEEGGILSFQIFKGGVKSEDFNGYMVRIISQLELETIDKDVVFFMDNASIHKNLDLREEIATKILIVYNAPYSPFLNAIEECFSAWKHAVRKKKPGSERELVEAILEGSHAVSREDCKKYIKHTIKFYKQCFDLEKIF